MCTPNTGKNRAALFLSFFLFFFTFTALISNGRYGCERRRWNIWKFLKVPVWVFMSSMILWNAAQRGIWFLKLERRRQKLQFYQSRSLLECEMIHAQSGCSLHRRSQDFISGTTQRFIPTPALSVRLDVACRVFFSFYSPCHKVVRTAKHNRMSAEPERT